MPWPSVPVASGDVITAAQLNLLPIRIADSTAGGGGAASFDFTSLSGGFAHLFVVVYGRGDAAATSVNVLARFNNDSAANYDWQQITGSNAVAAAPQGLAATSINLGNIPAATATANVFSGLDAEVPQYAGTVGQKMLTAKAGLKLGTTAPDLFTYLTAGYWRSTAAINRITILPSAGNFIAGSRATIYGLA